MSILGALTPPQFWIEAVGVETLWKKIYVPPPPEPSVTDEPWFWPTVFIS